MRTLVLMPHPITSVVSGVRNANTVTLVQSSQPAKKD